VLNAIHKPMTGSDQPRPHLRGRRLLLLAITFACRLNQIQGSVTIKSKKDCGKRCGC